MKYRERSGQTPQPTIQIPTISTSRPFQCPVRAPRDAAHPRLPNGPAGPEPGGVPRHLFDGLGLNRVSEFAELFEFGWADQGVALGESSPPRTPSRRPRRYTASTGQRTVGCSALRTAHRDSRDGSPGHRRVTGACRATVRSAGRVTHGQPASRADVALMYPRGAALDA
jgi:hypothetical protein